MEPVSTSQHKITQKKIERSIIALKQQLLGVILRFVMKRNTRKLNCFYSMYAKKKRDSHHYLKCIKKLEITPKSCCLSAIMLCSIYFELL